MIAITSNAARAVRRMTNTETYPEAGLSIRKIDQRRFALSVVPDRAGSDITIPGTNVYLDRPAAAALENATLDAVADATLAEQFVLEGANV